MYKAIRDPNRIASAQKSFLRRMRKEMPTKIPNIVVGHQGGSMKLKEAFANNIIWFAHELQDDEKGLRNWNIFGAGQPVLDRSNSIAVEVNIALQRRLAGIFALDEKTGNTILLHSGRIGGGKKGIGRKAFMKWCPGKMKMKFVDPSRDNKEREAIFVADLGSSDFICDIEFFVNAVHRFKASLDDPKKLSDSEISEKAASATAKSSKTAAVVVYARNPYVAEYAKRRARGICDLCRRRAPFKNASNEHYLECHHIVWLAHGGADCPENTVALCPNCHRKMHIVKDEKDINELQRRAKIALRD